LGGLIVIDFIDMEESRNRRDVENRLRDALRQDRARVQFGTISKFGLMEMSRQRLRPALSEGASIPCPRCGGSGHIRDTESSALQILRVIQEESLKDNTASVLCQVPVDVASFLLNEKRTEITKIELKQRINVLMVPNKTLERPNYKLERLKHDDPRLDHIESSYKMAEEIDDPTAVSRRSQEPTNKQTPVIKGVLPDAPAPQAQPRPAAAAPVAAAQPAAKVAAPAPAPAESGFFGWIKRILGGAPAVETPAAPAPAAPAAKAEEKREGRGGQRGEGGRGGRDGGRGRGRDGQARDGEGQEGRGPRNGGERGERPARGERPPRGEGQARGEVQPRAEQAAGEEGRGRNERNGRGERGGRGGRNRPEAEVTAAAVNSVASPGAVEVTEGEARPERGDRAERGEGQGRGRGNRGGRGPREDAPRDENGQEIAREPREPREPREAREPREPRGERPPRAERGERQERGDRAERPVQEPAERPERPSYFSQSAAAPAANAEEAYAPQQSLSSDADVGSDAQAIERGEAAVEGAEPQRREKRSRDRYGRDRKDRAPRENADGSPASAAFVPNDVALATSPESAVESSAAAPLAAAPVAAPVAALTTPPAAQIEVPKPVVPVVVAAAVAATEGGLPKVASFELPLAALDQVAQGSGLQWVRTDAERAAAVQAAIAAEPKPVHVPRERPAAVVIDTEPLVLVETKRDLRNMQLPF
jgi:ribonuclease E